MPGADSDRAPRGGTNRRPTARNICCAQPVYGVCAGRVGVARQNSADFHTPVRGSSTATPRPVPTLSPAPSTTQRGGALTANGSLRTVCSDGAPVVIQSNVRKGKANGRQESPGASRRLCNLSQSAASAVGLAAAMWHCCWKTVVSGPIWRSNATLLLASAAGELRLALFLRCGQAFGEVGAGERHRLSQRFELQR